MAQTKTTLILRVLQDLNVVGLGQTPDDEDTDAVSSRIETFVAELIARQIAYIPDTDSINDAVFEPLVAYLIAQIGPSYGRPVLDRVSIELIEDRIKDASRPSAARRTLSTDPFLREGNRFTGTSNFVTGR